MPASQEPGPGARAANELLAARLDEMADLLAAQKADGFRVSAYRAGARTLRGLAQPVQEIYQARGLDGLVSLPAIGKGIGSAIAEMLGTGRWSAYERLRGEAEPEQLFMTLPGVGPELARAIHAHLDAETLEDLEAAAHDGRLESVHGIGRRRAEAIRATLSDRLGRRYRPATPPTETPSVAMLLAVDRDYREKAAAGELARIAPKRFNPEGKAWLPVYHTEREPWQFTALFSNTVRAHDLGKTNDWVVIYFHTDHAVEGRSTVVTETHGPLTGKRVVRGREGDCIAHYSGY